MAQDSIAGGTLKFVGKWTPKMREAFNIIAQYWSKNGSYTTTVAKELVRKDQSIKFDAYGCYTYINNLHNLDVWIRESPAFAKRVGQAYDDLASEMNKHGSEITMEFVDAEPFGKILYEAEGKIKGVMGSNVLTPILEFQLTREKNFEYNSKNLRKFGYDLLAIDYDEETNRKPIVSVVYG